MAESSFIPVKVVHNGIENFHIHRRVCTFFYHLTFDAFRGTYTKKVHTSLFSSRAARSRIIVFIVDGTLALPRERQTSASIPRRSYVRETATVVSFFEFVVHDLKGPRARLITSRLQRLPRAYPVRTKTFRSAKRNWAGARGGDFDHFNFNFNFNFNLTTTFTRLMRYSIVFINCISTFNKPVQSHPNRHSLPS